MLSIKELVNFSQTPEYYGRFAKNNSNINLLRIDLIALCGEERNELKTPFNGDSTLVLRYKEAEGVLLSLITEPERLGITQLQGSCGKAGYRLTTELRLANLFADQVETIVNSEKSCFRRISMPPIEKIEGLVESSSEVVYRRYERLALILGLNYSKEEMLYVRDVKKN